jgi:hypothetical protein
VKLGKVPPASTAGVEPETKDQQTGEIWGGRCTVDIYKLRSIKSSPHAIVESSIACKKCLQIDVSMGMRAMRSVSSDAYQVHSSPHRGPLTNQGPFKAALNDHHNTPHHAATPFSGASRRIPSYDASIIGLRIRSS